MGPRSRSEKGSAGAAGSNSGGGYVRFEWLASQRSQEPLALLGLSVNPPLSRHSRLAEFPR
jgi:hypothetical protein